MTRPNPQLRSPTAVAPAITWCVCFALFLVAPLQAWDPASQGRVGRAVQGDDVVRALAPDGVQLEDYANAGYRLVRRDGEIRVSVETSPLGSTAPWHPPTAWTDDADEPISRLARSLTAGASSEYEVASRILGWVARNVDYELDREASQEAPDVLERRTAYCTGTARLTVALLESAGLAAREVAGWVVSDGPPLPGPVPQGFHRWVEIRYSDVGWAFSDPLYSHHFVPATYLRLASETVRPEQGLEGLLLERRDGIFPVDLFPPAPPGVRARRNDPRQVAASLRVELGQASPGLAILEGEAVRLTHALVDGATTFLGLEPGRYRLEVRVPGRPIVRRAVELRDRRPGRILVAPSRSAEHATLRDHEFHVAAAPATSPSHSRDALRAAAIPHQEPMER